VLGLVSLVHVVCGGRCYEKCPAPPRIPIANVSHLFQQQKLLHCHPNNIWSDGCVNYWNETSSKYRFFLREHYESLSKDANHSVNRINKNVKFTAEAKPRFYNVDLAIDARCYHSWTINPYHRIADCMVLILPTLYHFLELYVAIPSFKDTQKRILLLVDESTESLCMPSSSNTNNGFKVLKTSDSCLLGRFQQLLRNRLQYQCLSTSLYFASQNWFRKFNSRGVLANEFVILGEQKNPFTFGSGFDTVLSHPNYRTFLELYRNIAFDGLSCYCKFDPDSNPISIAAQAAAQTVGSINTISAKSQNLIVFLKRFKSSGRYIPQTEALLNSLRHLVNDFNEKMAGSLIDPYELVLYSGSEPMCSTVALFWSAKIIIGAHGAGLINTVFSRPNTLLIEISPDRIDQTGVPWRVNSAFASLCGLFTHVVVVPHNESAKTDRDIQVVYPMSLTEKHIDYIYNLSNLFLSASVLRQEEGYGLGFTADRATQITSLV
jgi:hypothetical protein